MMFAVLFFAGCACAIAPAATAQRGKPEPLWQAFAATFDANAPVTLAGTVIRTDWLEPKSVIWIQGSTDGGAAKLWRVDASAASLFSDADRAALAAGVQVHVRGYNAKDTSCTVTCRMAGRDFTLASGAKITARNGLGVCLMDQLLNDTCAAANRPGPPPTPN